MKKDLIVLVADKQQKATFDTLLSKRGPSLGIRAISHTVIAHEERDGGVYHQAESFLLPFIPLYHHALIVIDFAFRGAPNNVAELQHSIATRLHRNGWSAANCQVIVIEPELEAWVWATSNVVPQVLGQTWDEIHRLAATRGYWHEGQPKPHEPKALLDALLVPQKRVRDARLFRDLAAQVSLQGCTDAAFNLLCATLTRWFPGLQPQLEEATPT